MRIFFILCALYFLLAENYAQDKSISATDFNNLKSVADSVRFEGHKLSDNGNNRSAILKYQESYKLFASIRDSLGMSKCLNNLGYTYALIGNDIESLNSFYEAIEINILINNLDGLASNYINLASHYKKQENFILALQYYHKSKNILRIVKNESKYSMVLIGIANILSNNRFLKNDYDSAIYFYQKAVNIYSNQNDSLRLAGVYNNIGVLFENTNNYDSAIFYYQKAIIMKEKIRDLRGQIILNLNIGYNFMKQGNYGIALTYLNQGSKIALELDDKENYLHLLTNIIKCKIRLGYLEEADQLFAEYTILSDSIKNKERAKNLKELEVFYETEKTGRELEDQIKQTKAKTKLSNTFLAITLVIALLLVLTILFFKQHQYFQKKLKAKELERLKHQSLLQGQEDERNRIAKDLHDRMGARLSAIKLMTLTPKQSKTSITEMLDVAIDETREISHNLSTDMVTRFGLVSAINDVVIAINKSHIIEGKFITTNLEARLPRLVEKTLYHIILELVNNTIKHAAASTFFIQVAKYENDIDLLYEDDGKGFDLGKASLNGMGLKNLQTRAESINGTLLIDTSPGNGMHVAVNVKVT